MVYLVSLMDPEPVIKVSLAMWMPRQLSSVSATAVFLKGRPEVLENMPRKRTFQQGAVKEAGVD